MRTNPDPNATTITAVARMLAMADAEDKANADQSIVEAKRTFTITKDANGWLVACGHGNTALAEETIEEDHKVNRLEVDTDDICRPS